MGGNQRIGRGDPTGCSFLLLPKPFQNEMVNTEILRLEVGFKLKKE